jgi:hypothetical protein
MVFISRLIEHNSRMEVFVERTMRHGGKGVKFRVAHRVHTLGVNKTPSFMGIYLKKRRCDLKPAFVKKALIHLRYS